MGTIVIQNQSQNTNQYVLYARPQFSGWQQVFTATFKTATLPPGGAQAQFSIDNTFTAVLATGQLAPGASPNVIDSTSVTLNQDGNPGTTVSLSFSPPGFGDTNNTCELPGSFAIQSDGSEGSAGMCIGVGLLEASSPLALVMAAPDTVTNITPTSTYYIVSTPGGYSTGQIVNIQEFSDPQSIDLNRGSKALAVDLGNGQWDLSYE